MPPTSMTYNAKTNMLTDVTSTFCVLNTIRQQTTNYKERARVLFPQNYQQCMSILLLKKTRLRS